MAIVEKCILVGKDNPKKVCHMTCVPDKGLPARSVGPEQFDDFLRKRVILLKEYSQNQLTVSPIDDNTDPSDWPDWPPAELTDNQASESEPIVEPESPSNG